MSGALMPSSTLDLAPATSPTPVNLADSSEKGFDWTAAAIGAALGGLLTLVLTAGIGFRRHGQFAA
jgi:hypothetical protein